MKAPIARRGLRCGHGTWVLCVKLDLSGSDALEWLGKTFDLSKAYKQLAVLPDHQLHAVVGFPVWGEVAVLQKCLIAFCLSRVVFTASIRISQALWFLISNAFR